MKNFIRFSIILFLLSGFFNNIFAQNFEFYVQIPNKNDIPIFDNQKSGGQIQLFVKNQGVNELLDRYEIFVFEQTYPTARSLFLQQIYTFVTNDLQLMYDLNSNFPVQYPYTEEKPEGFLAYSPNDYGLVGAQTGLDLINAKGAWEVTKGNSNIIIGISDVKIELNHPDLQNQIIGLRGTNFSTRPDHGTPVAGAAAAATDNGIGISGIGFNSKILFSSNWNNMNELLLMSQIPNVRVLNASWINCIYKKTYQEVCNEIYENGVILVAGAGNKTGLANCGTRWSYAYPASYDNVISVTSVGHINPIGFTDPTNGLPNNWKDVHEDVPGDTTSSHVHNDKIDICAAGYNVLTTNVNGGYGGATGTSFSSPTVAGVCALVLAANPCLSPLEVEYIIKKTAHNLDVIPENQRYVGNLGAGRIDAEAAVKYARDFFDNIGNLPISINEIWDFPQNISGTVIIKQGASLTIKTKILFGTGSKIIVERGGKLIVDGGILSSGCTWEGIEVHGKGGVKQSISIQGLVEIKNNGIVENARTGIKSFTGGIVRVTSSTFKNNRFGIAFEPYHLLNGQSSNLSRIINSDFVCSRPMLDPQYTDNGVREGSKYFISVNQQDGIKIQNNDFRTQKNIAPNRPDLNGTGIRSFNSRINIVGNTFKDLLYGIESSGIQNLTKYNTISENTFDSVSLGISETAQAGSQILNNKFKLPEFTFQQTTPNYFFENYGMRIETSNAYLISGNEVKVSNLLDKSRTYGLIMRNSANKPIVERNNFINLQYANQTEGNNSELNIQCNYYKNNYQDWSINPQTIGTPYRFGTSGFSQSDKKAANMFPNQDGSQNAFRNIRVNPAVQFQYYSISSPDTSKPYLYNPSFPIQTIQVSYFQGRDYETECKIPTNPCNGNPSPCISYLQERIAYPGEIPEDELNFYKQILLQQYADSGMRNELISLASQNSTPYWDSINLPIYIDEGLFERSESILNSLDESDYKKFMQLMHTIKEQNLAIDSLGDTELITDLTNLAESKEEIAIAAQKILEFYYDKTYDHKAELWDEEFENNNGANSPVDTLLLRKDLNKTKENSFLALRPNPNNGEFIININKSDNNIIHIIDMQGKIWKKINANGQDELFIKKGELSPGVYFVRLLNELKGTQLNEELIIIE